MYPFECTKIIATIGPATSSIEKMRELIRAGADACRVNSLMAMAHHSVR